MPKKRYRVVGVLPVAGHAPGDEFTHEFAPHEEALLIESGAIALVSKPTKDGAKAAEKEG